MSSDAEIDRLINPYTTIELIWYRLKSILSLHKVKKRAVQKISVVVAGNTDQ